MTVQKLNQVVIKTASAVPESEFSPKFVQQMWSAMGVSFFKYGKVKDAYPNRVDAVANTLERIKLYREGGEIKGKKVRPGNIWYLVDAANFLMIESMLPRTLLGNRGGKIKPSWGRNDTDNSPGRTWNNGEKTELSNNRSSQFNNYKREGD